MSQFDDRLRDWLDVVREPRRRKWEATLRDLRGAATPLPYLGDDAADGQGASLKRVLILSHDNQICRSQIYPFFYNAQSLRARYDVELYEEDLAAFQASDLVDRNGFDIVIVQPWFDLGPEGVADLLDRVDRRCRCERLIFLDGFAPADLRFASVVADRVDLYVKKHVLRDRSQYGQPTAGDTNLTDYYSRRFGLEMPEFRYNVPSAFFEKLVVGPSFLTADYLMGRLTRGLPSLDGRRIDVHARLGREGVHWYEALRSEALTALMTIPGRHRTGFGVSRRRYLRELEQSRACFSPFGYGEVAWRDYEAVTFGSVLVKNDMSHLETEPDIFVPNKTYVPVQWDWTDLREKLESVLNDDTERRRIASNAYRVAADYVLLDGFARQVERLFD